MRTTLCLRVWVLMVAMVAAAVVVVVGVVLFDSSLASAQSISTEAVPGTTIKVNTKGDGSKNGNCSLREAIEAANTNTKVDRCAAGSDTDQDAILFSLGDKATITLGSSELLITDPAGLLIHGRKAKIIVSGNDAVRVFRVEPGAVLALRNLTVADGGNSFFAAGLLNNGGEVRVWNSTFSSNSATDTGGGIENLSGLLTVTNSTFSGNSADDGGGIENEGTLEVTNSTFSGNSADRGGGIRNDGTLEVTNSTFSGNSAADTGGGILATTFGTATLKNTIVANSTQGGNCRLEREGAIADGGYNIEDADTCGFSAANNSKPSTNPKLASSLANNGGPTRTLALLKGSPALNAIPEGTNGCGTEITTDQRGVSRPQGSGCDIGAFEKKVRRR